MPRNSWNRRVKGVLLLTIVLITCITAVYAGTPEQVSIQTLLAQAPSHHLHVVTLQGVTRGIEITPPFPFTAFSGEVGCVLYGRATFILEDGTGSLPVVVLGSCSPQAVDTLPKDGDVVRMTAMIHVLTTDLPVRVQAQATEIRILDSK